MSLVGFNIDCVNLNANKMLTDARDFDVTLVTDNSNQRVMFGFGSNAAGRVIMSDSNVLVRTDLGVSGSLSASNLFVGGSNSLNLFAPSNHIHDLAGGNIAGVLPANKGGTGVGNLTANKLLMGNGANAISTVDALHWNGTNLGVGTGTPSTLLHVNGDATFNSNINISGIVGIKTSSPAHALDVSGWIRAFGSSAGNGMLSTNTLSSGSSFYQCVGDFGGGLIMFQNGSTRSADGGAYTATLRNDMGDLRLMASSSNVGIIIKSNTGNVGIDKSPSSSVKLDVNGTVDATTLRQGGNNVVDLFVSKSGSSTITGSLTVTNSITAGGNGSATVPTAIVINEANYQGSVRASLQLGNWQLLQDINGNGTRNFSIYQGNWGGASAMNVLNITSSGFVGIGTTAPRCALDVSGACRISSTVAARPGNLGPTILVQWNTYRDLGAGNTWWIPQEAGNPVDLAAAPNGYTLNGSKLWNDASGEGTSFGAFRFIFRAAPASGGVGTYTLQPVQSREAVRLTLGNTFNITTMTSWYGYLTYITPWIDFVYFGDRNGIGMTLNSVSADAGFLRIGTVMMQFC